VAYFCKALLRAESTPAAAVQATQCTPEVARVWYASAWITAFLWHLPACVVECPVGLHLTNLAKDQETHAYLIEVVDHHQSLTLAAACTFRAALAGRTTRQPQRL